MSWPCSLLYEREHACAHGTPVGWGVVCHVDIRCTVPTLLISRYVENVVAQTYFETSSLQWNDRIWIEQMCVCVWGGLISFLFSFCSLLACLSVCWSCLKLVGTGKFSSEEIAIASHNYRM